MSVREITRQIARLKPSEQDEVAAYLRALHDERTPAARRKLTEAHAQIERGQHTTLEELRRSADKSSRRR